MLIRYFFPLFFWVHRHQRNFWEAGSLKMNHLGLSRKYLEEAGIEPGTTGHMPKMPTSRRPLCISLSLRLNEKIDTLFEPHYKITPTQFDFILKCGAILISCPLAQLTKAWIYLETDNCASLEANKGCSWGCQKLLMVVAASISNRSTMSSMLLRPEIRRMESQSSSSDDISSSWVQWLIK